MSIIDSINDASAFAEGVADDLGISSSFFLKEKTGDERGFSFAAQNLLKAIDNTAQRSYINSGFSNNDRTKPNIKNIITQTPELIILIKKRMFSSLAENYDEKYMNKDERHFYRAAKKLFENKCNEVSAYERLTKLTKILYDVGELTNPLAQAIYKSLDAIEGNDFNSEGGDYLSGILYGSKTKDFLMKHKDAIQKIRAALSLNGFNQTTTWIKDDKRQNVSNAGKGTGVIELTIVTSFECTSSVNLGEGSASFSILDPNRMLMITEADIERALYQTSYEKYALTNYLTSTMEADNDDDLQYLNELRLTRGASSITVKTDVSSRMYNKVIMILDRLGYEITDRDGGGLNFDKLNNDPNVPAYEKFTNEEKKLITSIYKRTFKILSSKLRDFEDYRKYNYEANYARKLMRLNFLGKQLIQPMDNVYAYIDSQRIEDSMVIGGLKESFLDMSDSIMSGTSFAGLGSANLLGMLDKTFGDINNIASATKKTGSGPSGGFDFYEAEKNMLVGADFPIWLWNLLRPNFTGSTFGTCCFCGVVQTVNESYSDGSYTVTVSCKDNAYYFEQGYINTKPGLDQFNGYLYDPLTPFDFTFDAATGLLPDVSQFKLLPENLDKLNSNLYIMEDGKNAGYIANSSNIMEGDIEPILGLSQTSNIYSNIARRIYSMPEGMVYRWKSGIGSAIINQSGTTDGAMSSKLIQDNYGLVTVSDPFGGQDLFNVISILVCGEPYNFNTFMKSAQEFGTINIQASYNPDIDYFTSLFKAIKKQNKIWGNFIPFKKFSTDPTTFSKTIALQTYTYAHSTSIKTKMNERAQLLNKLIQFEGTNYSFDIMNFSAPLFGTGGGATTINSKNSSITNDLIKKIVLLDGQIQLHSQAITDALENETVAKSVIAVGSNIYYSSSDDTTPAAQRERYRLLISQQNQLTKRHLWQVKANIDQNLFIIGTECDMDSDIQALAQSLTGDFSYLNSSWTTVKEKLSQAISVLGLELFANSQGHIELRSPKYNRIPSTILFEMFRMNSDYGIKVYPDFLEKLFSNQVESVFTDIELLEDEIRLRAIALGADPNTNGSIEGLLDGTLVKNAIETKFAFISGSDGSLSSLRAAVGQIAAEYKKAFDNPDSFLGGAITVGKEAQDIFKSNPDAMKLKLASNTINTYDIYKQVTNITQIYRSLDNNLIKVSAQDAIALSIRKRISTKSGRPIDSVKTVDQMLPNSKNGKLSPLDLNTLQNELDSLVSRRYEAINIAINLVKNIDAAARINTPGSDVLKKLLLPNLYGQENIPDFLKEMVENESYDDYGRGAGKRFVINEKDIINMSYNEDNPEFSSVELSGSEVNGIVGGRGFEIGNGIKLSNVRSVDYDLWRMYGYKETQLKDMPFLNNAELQLAPYALFLLNRERAKIFKSRLTVAGNEFIQAGEVYYIRERGMLFYAKSRTHNFSYGGSFTTTLNLEYGRVPGEYIPTPLDIIGKTLYKNMNLNIGSHVTTRPDTKKEKNSVHLGSLIYIPQMTGTVSENLLQKGALAGQNLNTILNIFGKLNILLPKTIPNSNYNLQGITVRIYGNNSTLQEAANEAIKFLTNKGIPTTRIIGGNSIDGEKGYNFGIPMIVMSGDKIQTPNPRNPSADCSKLIENAISSGIIGNIASIEDAIKNCVIDIWLENNITLSNTLFSKLESENTLASISANNKNTAKQTAYLNMQAEYKNLQSNFDTKIKIATT